MKNFKTYQLSVSLYKFCSKLRLPSHLKNQLLRSASSVPLNLAEGRGKSSLKDQLKFFDIAMGSLRETEAILKISNCQNQEVLQLLDQAAAALFCLIRSQRGL